MGSECRTWKSPKEPSSPRAIRLLPCKHWSQLVDASTDVGRYRWFMGPFGQDLQYWRPGSPRYGLIHEIPEFRRLWALPSTANPRTGRDEGGGAW